MSDYSPAGSPEEPIRIGELARRAGVTSRAIRQLHAVGLLPEVPRDGSGSRMYGPAELELLLRIGRLKADGLAVDEIARILATGPASGRR